MASWAAAPGPELQVDVGVASASALPPIPSMQPGTPGLFPLGQPAPEGEAEMAARALQAEMQMLHEQAGELEMQQRMQEDIHQLPPPAHMQTTQMAPEGARETHMQQQGQVSAVEQYPGYQPQPQWQQQEQQQQPTAQYGYAPPGAPPQ